MNKKISIVVPMYNEQEVATEFYNRTTTVLKNTPFDYEIIIVNDASATVSSNCGKNTFGVLFVRE